MIVVDIIADMQKQIDEIGIAGGLAGAVMAFFNCPIELLKVKLQVQDPAGVIGANGKLEPPVSISICQGNLAKG